MWSLTRKVWRDLTRRPARALLTVLGIAIGVAGLVAIVSTARNLARAQRALFQDSSQADLAYWVWDAPSRLAPLLQSDARIARAELRLTYNTRWQYDQRWRDVELIGIDDFGAVRLNQFEIVAGRAPEAGQVLVDLSASQSLGVAPGDQFTFQDHDGRARALTVSGISKSPSYLSSQITNVDVGYVPATLLRRQLDIAGNNQLLIGLEDVDDSQAVVEHLTRLFRRLDLQTGQPQIRRPDAYPGKRELDALLMIMMLFSALGLVLSALLVANTLSASVAEQVDEIAVLKTLGGLRRHIILLYLAEGLAYGLLGTALGLGLGALLGWRLLVWIGELGNATVRFALAPEGVGFGLLVGLGVTVASALVPAWRGAHLSVHEALAEYGISVDYGGSRLDRWLQRLRSLPPLALMAIRGLSRRTARTTLTLLVIALATASFVGALTTRSSVNRAIDDVYATYNTDAWVWLNQSVPTRFEQALATLEGVSQAEGWGIANGHVGLVEARLWGLPSDTQLYRYVLSAGRWYGADEADAVVLSNELADRLGLSVGHWVEIQVDGASRSLRIVGVAIDNTIFLGGTLAGKAFMPRRTLQRLQNRGDLASLYAIGVDDAAPEQVDRVARAIEQRYASLRPSVQPVYAEIASAQRASRLLTLALLAMLIIVALVAALGILNTLTLNVLERRREIAVLRAMGGTDGAILIAFVTEGLALGLLGWLLGLALGYPAGWLFTQQLGRVLFDLDYVTPPWMIPASLAFTLFLSIAASLGPALGAAHTSASAALRYE